MAVEKRKSVGGRGRGAAFLQRSGLPSIDLLVKRSACSPPFPEMQSSGPIQTSTRQKPGSLVALTHKVLP